MPGVIYTERQEGSEPQGNKERQGRWEGGSPTSQLVCQMCGYFNQPISATDRGRVKTVQYPRGFDNAEKNTKTDLQEKINCGSHCELKLNKDKRPSFSSLKERKGFLSKSAQNFLEVY